MAFQELWNMFGDLAWRLGLGKTHKHYFDESEYPTYWNQDVITWSTTMMGKDENEVKKAVAEWMSKGTLQQCGIKLIQIPTSQFSSADIQFQWNSGLPDGGWTHWDEQEIEGISDHLILRAQINVSTNIKRGYFYRVLLHEIKHALTGDAHSDDRKDIAHSPIEVNNISNPDRNTTLMHYSVRAQRRKSGLIPTPPVIK